MEEKVKVPEGITASIASTIVTLKGPKGELKRNFLHPRVKVEIKDSSISFSALKATKREKTVIGTFVAHTKNMLKGVKEGHVYKLKICSGHFPMNVSMAGSLLMVKNFLGEKFPRALKLKEGVKVKVEGTEVIVESIDKEIAGQVAADIEKLTHIRKRDKRIFQDGIYIVNKDGKDMLKA